MLSASCASMTLSGAPAALPGVAGLIHLGATALAAVGCLGLIVEELGSVREKRLALMRADAEDVEALRHSMRKRPGDGPRLP